jgi:hypothetical protein
MVCGWWSVGCPSLRRRMSPDEARECVASNHRAVLVTRRPSGGLQEVGQTTGVPT